MIIHLYKDNQYNLKSEFIVTKNIECVPSLKTFITYNNQRFHVGT